MIDTGKPLDDSTRDDAVCLEQGAPDSIEALAIQLEFREKALKAAFAHIDALRAENEQLRTEIAQLRASYLYYPIA